MANIKTYSKSKDGATKLSKNLSVREFACNDGSDLIKIDLDMIPVLQRYREYVESALTFNSAYRTVTYNKRCGGASNSYHLYGRAFDIPFSTKYKYLTSLEKMCAFFNTLGVKGIILYSTFIHVDSRPSKYHATSSGARKTYGVVNIPFRSTLKKGQKNVDVGIVQFKLNSLGYNCGHADMDFGNNTYNAVISFQKNNNLQANGVVDSVTWKKLFA